MSRISQFISYLFHPLWMPLYLFVTAWYVDPYLSAFVPVAILKYLLLILIINIVAPAVSILMLRYRNLITSLHLRKREERFLPFLIVLAYYILTYFLLRFKEVPVPDVVYSMLLCLVITLALVLAVNTRFKISIHLTAIGGVMGTIWALSNLHDFDVSHWLLIILALAGVVSFARLHLMEHTHAQIYTGFALGLVISYFTVANQFVI